MSFTTCTSAAIVRKAGKNASSIATASGALLQDYADQAESVVCMKTHKDWVAGCLLYTSPSPRDGLLSRMPSSA